MVRGFALFGVLLVNMFHFGAYSDEWTSTLDRLFAVAKESLFHTKSWRLFSMLFGFGFFLQLTRARGRRAGFFWFYFRRLAILFVIGMGHALIYDGDILMKYAALGLLLPLFWRVPARWLLTASVVLMASYPIGNTMTRVWGQPPEPDPELQLTLVERRDGHPYMGSLPQAMEANAYAIPPRLFSRLQSPESSLGVFAMFLLGLAVGRSRLMEDVVGHERVFRRVMVWGLSIGLASMLLQQVLSWRFGWTILNPFSSSPGVQIVGDVLFVYGSTALALGYAATIIALSLAGRCTWLLSQFGYLGRMALTVYLSGSLLLSLLFYGYGFGQLFLLGPAWTTAYAVLFFFLQIGFCAWWLKRFRFGPLEWAWRSLSYGKLQPNRPRPS
jgi:uncharacterized protein